MIVLKNELILLDPWLWPEGFYESESVHPSIILFFCPVWKFSWVFFLKLSMVLEAHVVLFVKKQDFL